jgi:hypothetical protein
MENYDAKKRGCVGCCTALKSFLSAADGCGMRNVFLEHIYVMYAIWAATGAMLLVYIAFRRKRIESSRKAAAQPPTEIKM